MGFMKIYNNLIVNAGETFEPGNPDETRSGIYVGYVEGALSPNATFSIYNNTIISPKSFGITYNNSQATMAYIKNNLITDPGYPTGNNNYINLMVSESKVEQSNNFLSENNTRPKFIDAYGDDYDLKPDSPAVNYGTSLAAEGITFDILNRARPFHTYFDAGAFECHDPSAGFDENNDESWYPYPVPAKEKINIPVFEDTSWPLTIKISSVSGNIVYNKTYSRNDLINSHLEIDLDKLKAGSYIISMESNERIYSSKLTLY